MKEYTERLFACDSECFSRLDESLICEALPPAVTKIIALGNTSALIRSLNGRVGRVISDTELTAPHKSFALYRLDDVIIHSDPRVTEATDNEARELALLFKRMYLDTEGIPLNDERSLAFANSKRSNTFVLRSNGEICAMARLAYIGEHYGRINTVITHPEHRGKGYAKALVVSLCSALLSAKIIPTVLADVENVAANKLYSSIGFRRDGYIYQYTLTNDISENPLIINTLS